MNRKLILLLGLVLVLVLVTACGGGASAVALPQNVSMTATEFKFDPATINASPGQAINLTVKNIGTVQHTWVLPTSNIKLTIDPGQSVSKTFTAPTAPGTYPFECDEPGHKEAGMVGQLIVK